MEAIAVAIGVWWHANTISHIFIHRPFRSRAASVPFAALLTALLGFPQSVWRDRHLAHHRGAAYRFRPSLEFAIQAGVLTTTWMLIALKAPGFFVSAYLPGLALGLLLCAVHGHYEHAGGTTSHYGRLYNLLCFNDGYHVEHHRHPSAPWRSLPLYRQASTRRSRWPAPLRWLERGPRPLAALVVLERVVLHSRLLQRWVVRAHARAFRALLSPLPPPGRITVVGGGVFPRTAIALRDLFPHACITIVDASESSLERARRFLNGSNVTLVRARITADSEPDPHSAIYCQKCDLMIFPLSFDGDRDAIYARPPAPVVVVHDWMWRTRGRSRVVSWMLLKRLNLVES